MKTLKSHFRSESKKMSYVTLFNLLTVYLVFYLKEKRTYNLFSFFSPKIEIGEDGVRCSHGGAKMHTNHKCHRFGLKFRLNVALNYFRTVLWSKDSVICNFICLMLYLTRRGIYKIE